MTVPAQGRGQRATDDNHPLGMPPSDVNRACAESRRLREKGTTLFVGTRQRIRRLQSTIGETNRLILRYQALGQDFCAATEHLRMLRANRRMLCEVFSMRKPN